MCLIFYFSGNTLYGPRIYQAFLKGDSWECLYGLVQFLRDGTSAPKSQNHTKWISKVHVT